ncbi:ornithine cyclodeaminase family protein [Bacillus sp. AK128]
MKYFNEKEIRSIISMKGLIDELERFYLNKKEVNIPDRLHIDDKDNTILIMPAFDPDYYAIKLVGVAPRNKELNKPSIHGTVILHDRHTLEPLVFYDGSAVTGIRTGAIGGLGMKHLSSKTADSIGIIGTGIQGWSHLEASLTVRDIKKVYLYNRSKSSLHSFQERVQNVYPHLSVFVATNVEELVLSSDIVVTTTTSSSPVISELSPVSFENKLFVAVGSFKPSMQELPNSLLKNINPIYVDTKTALVESGDMLKAQELQKEQLQVLTLDDLINNKSKQPSKNSYTIFKSVGMSLFDLLTVKFIYEQSQ